jgi:hypothetical protein
MPYDTGVLGLHARVTCQAENCKPAEALISSGTFDATEIVPAQAAEPATPVVGAK